MMFRAVHIFGPMAGDVNDVMMASPTIPKRLWYAPVPEGVTMRPFPNGYMLVGVTFPPEAPWPGQVEYVLDVERSALAIEFEGERGAVQGAAVYVLAGDS